MARLNRFAHLLGLARAEDKDEEKKQRPDESDEDYAKRMEEEDKDKDPDGKKGKKGKKAEGDDEDKDKDKDPDGKKGKKAKDGDEDKDEERKDNEEAGRKAERARCAAIFHSAAAGVRPDVAAHLAFETDMPAAEAVSLLGSFANGTAKGARDGLAGRMAAVRTPNVGVDGGAAVDPSSPTAVAAAIVAAGKKRRGEA